MFPFDPSENIRKSLLLMFSGGPKWNIGKKMVKEKISENDICLNKIFANPEISRNLAFLYYKKM